MHLFDEILDNACPNNVEGNVKLFWIETHCVGWWIKATRNDDGTWTIISAEPEDC